MVTHTAETCLGVLKQLAIDLLKSAKSGNPAALKLFEQYFENSSNRSVLKLNQAQQVIARECGFASWPKLKSGLEMFTEQNELPPPVLYNTLIVKIARRIAADDTRTKSKPEKQDDDNTLFCRFCSKSQDQVKMYIIEPAIYVCVDCVDDYYRYLTPYVPGMKNIRKDDITLCCNFCLNSQHDVTKLIAGPHVFICDECVGRCNEIIAKEDMPLSICDDCVDDYYRSLTPYVPGLKNIGKEPNADYRPLCCNFCHKTQHEVMKLIAGPHVLICDECVGLCNEIIAEELG